jgi:putative NADPH-quinone reductase
VVKDDMRAVLERALQADLIVWATPVFCWSPSWLLKMALDRFYCTFKFTGGDDVRCLLQGRKMAAVITAGGGENDGADSVRETCRRFAQFASCQWIDAFIAGNVETPETIRADAKLTERARAFGRQLAS